MRETCRAVSLLKGEEAGGGGEGGRGGGREGGSATEDAKQMTENIHVHLSL